MKVIAVPFVGNKRYRVKEIAEIVKDGGYREVIEPFGGSCVISANIQKEGLADCVANDYDGFIKQLPEIIQAKEDTVAYMFSIGAKPNKRRQQPEHIKEKLQAFVSQYEPFIRKHISNNFLFSSRRTYYDGEGVRDFQYFLNRLGTEEEKEFNQVMKSVKTDSLDYKDFLNKYIDKNSGQLVVIDPPYLNSMQKGYNNETFFGLRETIELLGIMQEFKTDFIFFNQQAEDMKALLELFGFEYELYERFSTVGAMTGRSDALFYIRQ